MMWTTKQEIEVLCKELGCEAEFQIFGPGNVNLVFDAPLGREMIEKLMRVLSVLPVEDWFTVTTREKRLNQVEDANP
jgi:hypothetical protein